MEKKPCMLLPELALLVIALGVVHIFDLNRTLFFTINSISTITGSFLWANLTILGDALVAAVFVFLYIKKNPKLVWSVLIASVITTALVHILKPLLAVARPPAVLENSLITIIGPALHGRSFPSGHSATIFTLLGIFMLNVPKLWQRICLFVFALLVSISRIVVGVHWPIDVLAGALIGVVGAYSGFWFVFRIKWGANRMAQLIWGGIFLIATIILLFFYDTHYQEAFWLQRIIAVVVLLAGGIDYGRLIADRHLKAGKT